MFKPLWTLNLLRTRALQTTPWARTYGLAKRNAFHLRPVEPTCSVKVSSGLIPTHLHSVSQVCLLGFPFLVLHFYGLGACLPELHFFFFFFNLDYLSPFKIVSGHSYWNPLIFKPVLTFWHCMNNLKICPFDKTN